MRRAFVFAALVSLAASPPAQSAELLSKLKSADAQEREAAAWEIGAIADPAAVPALMPLLRDPDRGVRATAAWALYETGTSEARRAVYAALLGKDEDLAKFVLRSLEVKYEPAAQEVLVKAVQGHPNADVRARAFEVLEKNFTPDLLPVFKAVAAGTDEVLKLKALPILVRRKLLAEGDDLVPVFAKFLSHADPGVRAQAIWGLRGVADERVLDVLERAIKDPAPNVREAALQGFCALADRRVMPQLQRMYAAASAADRATILSAVPAERFELMTPVYDRALLDRAPEVRVALMRAMRYRFYPDREVTRPYFSKGAQDADVEVRKQAAGGLTTLPVPPLDLLDRLARDKSREVRMEVVKGLAERDDGAGPEVLVLATSDADPEIRLGALESVRKAVSAERAVAALRPLTKDADARVRAAAVVRIRGPADKKVALEITEEALRDASPEVRASGIENLRALEVKDWVDRVGAFVADPAPLVRQAAVEAIKYQGGSKALPYLAKALDDTDVGVRRGATMAFGSEKRIDPAVVEKLKALRAMDPDFLVRASAESALRSVNAIPGVPSVINPYAASGGIPADLASLFVFPGTIPRQVTAPANPKMLGKYEAVDKQKTPQAFHTVVFEKDAKGKIFYTSWGARGEAVVSDRFSTEAEYPGTKFLSFWAPDGGYKQLSWTKAKDYETRGATTFVLSDDGRTLTYTQMHETRRSANPVVESLKQQFRNPKKLAEALERMGLKEGPQTEYQTMTYTFRRVAP